ncbi:uncharacterized protein PGTG_22418 [Puccinia graminis f. sp. tritici CRL 75-36-700-3]|uniref:Serine/threonine-protein phosphatase 4 regulatory subunit 3-like central domain-containing protein n=1 Tax=Puccinia graminis f. sp. tritici (strain CRL 75-36-700-3 / race SCCL) TaxID=418459 RepID=H6QUK8_PUCGT|nr:uncharacterized protein PGTG_22418 [Puccinia graminis f. sp. tritici CRL 75-36-700-3]EHS64722.1 hypothetical protein PGTG_22418 [Puccinia graminis f. sp. tritici CRL 75-36-700-3]
MLNDAAIYEYCLQDEVVLIAASILDYDPEFGNQKASYHADLSDPTRFKEVVPIRDEQIKSKIHLTYRLQYFKDIILARIMDDSTFSIINSMLFFNQVEIVQYLHSSDHFMRDLFGIFDMGTDPPPASSSSPIIGPPLPPSMRKIDTIMFLQQLCSMAKHLQAPSRISFFRSLAERGILKVIEFGLSKENLTNRNTDPSAEEEGSTAPPKTDEVREEEAMIKSVVCEILMTIIDYDPSSVRGYCLKQRQEGTKTLAESLIELLISEADLGLKVQLTDALRTLLDMGGTGLGNPSTNMALADSNGLLKRDEDPDNERFLQFFYDHCVHVLARPFLQLPELIPYAPDDQEPVSITPLEAATFNHLCEMICFIIVQHSFRSKYFILSTNLLNKIGSLLRIIGPRTMISPSPTSKTTLQGGKPRTAEDEKDQSVVPPHPQQIQKKKKSSYKYLELVGLKILKTCFNKKDQFYDRALIKNSLIDHVVLDLFVFQDGKDNLVSSACLELFENIRLNNPKPILNHLMDKRPDLVRLLAQKFNTFHSLIQRWEQNNEHQNAQNNAPNSQSSTNPAETSTQNVRNIGSWSRSRTLDVEEENYFNDSDEEGEEGGGGGVRGSEVMMIANTSRMGAREAAGQHKRQRSMTGVNPEILAGLRGEKVFGGGGGALVRGGEGGGVKPLVDYPDEDEEAGTSESTTTVTGPSTTTRTTTAVGAEEAEQGLSGEPPPKVRLGERRRREEDEEDLLGLGGLVSGASGRDAKRGKRSVPMARIGPATKPTSSSSSNLFSSQKEKPGSVNNSSTLPVGVSPTTTNVKQGGNPAISKLTGVATKKIVLSLASSSLIAASSSPPSSSSSASSSAPSASAPVTDSKRTSDQAQVPADPELTRGLSAPASSSSASASSASGLGPVPACPVVDPSSSSTTKTTSTSTSTSTSTESSTTSSTATPVVLPIVPSQSHSHPTHLLLHPSSSASPAPASSSSSPSSSAASSAASASSSLLPHS